MILIDASAAIEVVIDSPRSSALLAYVQNETLVAPELLPVEVASALARLERAGALTRRQADDALALFLDMPVHLISHANLVQSAWSLRHQVRVADAFYLSCALALDAPVLTLDRRLARSGVAGVRFLSISET